MMTKYNKYLLDSLGIDDPITTSTGTESGHHIGRREHEYDVEGDESTISPTEEMLVREQLSRNYSFLGQQVCSLGDYRFMIMMMQAS